MGAIRWRRWFGPPPGHREARAISWIALAAGVLLCVVAVAFGFHGKTFLGRPLGGDFVEFYTLGTILDKYPPARIYDLPFAVALQHAALPAMPETQMLVFGQAPFIAPLFRPFAKLPYAWAYVAWLVCSAGLYVTALLILFRTLRLNSEDRKTGMLLALSSAPFLFESWIGGQVSVIAFLLWVLFFWFLSRNRPFSAGFLLALCLFKPTLVALPVLMLLIGRRWRVVVGFASGTAGAALLSLRAVGVEGYRGWLQALALNGKTASQSGEAWHLAKNVDILAFFHLLLYNQPRMAATMAIAASVIAVWRLAGPWWKSNELMDRELWAATLCFTLIINAYAPIYDSILLVIAAALLRPRGSKILAVWLPALYLVSWITQSSAEFLHLQLITLLIAGLGFSILFERAESTIGTQLSPQAAVRFESCSKGLL